MTKQTAHIFALHRYFLWANRMRQQFRWEIQSHGPPPEDKRELHHWLIVPFGYFSMWMAMLYVVVEGWEELGLSDNAVQRLLHPERIALLKRYRNGVYHFQKTYFDHRFTEFIEGGDPIANWVEDLHKELSRFFLGWFKDRGMLHKVTEETDGSLRLEVWDKRETRSVEQLPPANPGGRVCAPFESTEA